MKLLRPFALRTVQLGYLKLFARTVCQVTAMFHPQITPCFTLDAGIRAPPPGAAARDPGVLVRENSDYPDKETDTETDRLGVSASGFRVIATRKYRASSALT